jgi:hypothetical protein
MRPQVVETPPPKRPSRRGAPLMPPPWISGAHVRARVHRPHRGIRDLGAGGPAMLDLEPIDEPTRSCRRSAGTIS